jgi:predicted anti-sigma-YlaC factor YlaD
MPDLVHNKLGAYLDGELTRRDQIEIESHLSTCQACRNELEELRAVSHLLHASPAPEFTSALDFKAQLMLQLPRRDESHETAPNSHLLLWLAPVIVLAVWIFFQVTLGLSTLLLFAKQAGFLDGAAAWLTNAPQQMLWFTTAQSVTGGTEGLTGLSYLNNADLFVQNLVTLLLWQVGVAVVYWGALTLVWHNKVKMLWNSFTTG